MFILSNNKVSKKIVRCHNNFYFFGLISRVVPIFVWMFQFGPCF